jgi:hypothetical protein
LPHRSFLRSHAPAVVATILIAVALLVTGEMIVALLTGIGVASLVPFAEQIFGGPPQGGSDKLGHVLLFFVHTATLARSLSFAPFVAAGAAGRLRAASPERAAAAPPALSSSSALWIAGLLSFLYGGALELLQAVVGRLSDPRDILANGAGAALCVAWLLFLRGRR